MSVRTIHYVFEEPLLVKGGKVSELLATVGTVSLAALGEHAKLRRIYQVHFDLMAGLSGKRQPTQEEWEKVDPALIANNGLWQRWARVNVALRTIKVGSGAEGAALMEVGLDFLGWESLPGLGTMPVDLFEALDLAVVQCNPRIFGALVPEDADLKNVPTVGVISVT